MIDMLRLINYKVIIFIFLNLFCTVCVGQDYEYLIRNRVICEGDSFSNQHNYVSSNFLVFDTINGSPGNDTIYVTQYNVSKTKYSHIKIDLCEGDSVLVGNLNLCRSGVCFDTLSSATGCDSIIIYDLRVAGTYQYFELDSFCFTRPPISSLSTRDSLVIENSSFQGNELDWGISILGRSGDSPLGMHVDNCGSVFITSSYSGTIDLDPTSSSFQLNAQGTSGQYGGAFIAKYNSDSTLEWGKAIGGNCYPTALYGCSIRPNCISVRENGDVVVSGMFRGGNVDFDPGPSQYLLTTPNIGFSTDPSYEVFVLTLNDTGGFKSVFTFDGNNDDAVSSMELDQFGNIYLCGQVSSLLRFNTVDFDPSPDSLLWSDRQSGTNGYIVKYNSVGSPSWVTIIGENGEDGFTDISLVGDTLLIATGNVFDSVDLDPSPSSFYIDGNQSFLPFFASYDTSGNLINANSRAFGSPTYTRQSVCISNNGRFYFTGHDENEKIYIRKYDSSFNLIWDYSNLGNGKVNSCTVDGNENLFITGKFGDNPGRFDPNSNVSLLSNGGGDCFLVKYDSLGQYLWGWSFGSSQADEGFALSSFNNSLFISGNFWSQMNISYQLLDTVLLDGSNQSGGSVFVLKLKNGFYKTYEIYDVLSPYFSFHHFDLCIGDTLSIGGLSISESGRYFDTVSTTRDCDSVFVYDTHFYYSDTFQIIDSICRGDTLIFRGNYFLDTGSFTFSIPSNTIACDTLFIISLLSKTSFKVTVDTNLCSGDTLLLGARRVFAPGVYFDTFSSVSWCDSVIRYNVSFSPEDSLEVIITLCPEDTFFVADTFFIDTGRYTVRISRFGQCDSVLNLLLAEGNNDFIKSDTSICNNVNFFFGGNLIIESGIYFDTLRNNSGCDSVISLEVDFDSLNYYDTVRRICQGDTILFNDRSISTAGSYYDTLVNVNGCDSIVNLLLDINLIDTTVYRDTLINNFDSVIVGDSVFRTSGYFLVPTLGLDGCDSLIQVYIESSTQVGDNSITSKLVVYPVPTSRKIHLNVDAIKSESAFVVIIDLYGSQVYSKSIFLNEGQNVLELDLENLKGGIYQMTVMGESVQFFRSILKL